MKTIYPEETLALLAKYDELVSYIEREYQRLYPDPPDALREILGEQLYAEKYHEVRDKRRRGILEDPGYQWCVREKANTLMRSPCTYQLDAGEVQEFHIRSE
jgi:hypothetical protein